MQLLFIFIIICCTLISLGLLCMAYLWRKAQHLAKQNPASNLTRLHVQLWCLGGTVLGLMLFTAGMFMHIGEAILYLPLCIAAPCFLQALCLYRRNAAQTKQAPPTHHWAWEELSKHVTHANYIEKTNFAEKNTLEMQAFGNDMYMSQSHHIQGQYKDLPFEQYDLHLPDYFTGRSLIFTLRQPVSSKIFIIHKDFPCSQLLTYAGLWKKELHAQELGIAIDSSYTLFSKEMDKAPQDLTAPLIQALKHLQQKYCTPHSYYLENQKLYVLMKYDLSNSTDNNNDTESKRQLLQQDIHIILETIDILAD